MDYMTLKEAASKWQITTRRMQVLCRDGRIEGAVRFGNAWAVPINAEKPTDARVKSGKYIKREENNKLKIFSFFSGSGFLDLGFEKAGYEIELVNEFQPNFMRAYQYSREVMGMRKPTYGYFNIDVNDFLTSRKDELKDYVSRAKSDGSLVGFIGGPPCPDFSIAGKRLGFNSQKSHLGTKLTADEPSVESRGQLYMWMRDVITLTSPKIFIAENVKGLTNLEDVKEIIEHDFAEAGNGGYLVVSAKVLNASNYGVPQGRERVIWQSS